MTKRINFGKLRDVLEVPDLIGLQVDSYRDFLQRDVPPAERKNQGLQEVFNEIFPIESFDKQMSLEFVSYEIGAASEQKGDVVDCIKDGKIYDAPLYVDFLLKVNGAEVPERVYMGDIPIMTEQGTFVINGAERVIISQLHRSPGICFEKTRHTSGRTLYSYRIIPDRGSWMDVQFDINDYIYIYLDRRRRRRKFYITTFLRAIGYPTNRDILSECYEVKKHTVASLLKQKDLSGFYTVDDITTEDDVLVIDELVQLTENHLKQLVDAGIREVELAYIAEGDNYLIGCLRKDPARNEEDALKEIYRRMRPGDPPNINNAKLLIKRLFFDNRRYDLGAVGRYKLNERLKQDVPLTQRTLDPKDLMAATKMLIKLRHVGGQVDDIDHLGARRVRTVGELLQNQCRAGLLRTERLIRERMTFDEQNVTPSKLINPKAFAGVIRDFFARSQLSQFMDQTNPLSELTNKRRLSALGPGGLSRDRAGFEVRDVHSSHYGRICPIETPEGPNIGLISSMSLYAIIDEYGFLETPYRKVVDGQVTDQIDYLTADKEEQFVIAQANALLDENNRFVRPMIMSRFHGESGEHPREEVQYMDVSPKQLVSAAAGIIPFLEHDDANRALMGSNMQRQAVPLLMPESPYVGTGLEARIARDSRAVVVAKEDGIVAEVSSSHVLVTPDGKLPAADADKSSYQNYRLYKYLRSNAGTCVNQRPVVAHGDVVHKGDVLADGAATQGGELALGRNVLVAFMPWCGYNFEDAIIVSERLVKEDVYTSIHVDEFEITSRETKLGPEEITRDIPNVGDDALKDLDENGIIRIGAEVHAGDILVGKVTPKGETELTAEERLLRAIFGEKAREVRDNSLKVPHGEAGIIIDVKIFTRENCDELSAGVNKLVRCYIAQKRKISVGDKMAGRHGNKGVVSRILPEEDMPFLPDGTPLDIVLNPLGVPSRMNIGQVLEVHLGMAAKALGWHVMTPVFDGAHEDDIRECFREANRRNEPHRNDPFDLKPMQKVINPKALEFCEDGKFTLYDGRTGEKFDNRVTVGYMHYLKLHHLVDEKIHARSVGPYSLVTQQPLGGKAQFGGQRFGEMEVWALEAYGAAYTLQEILTVKSDDTVGRVETYEAIVKGQNVPKPGIPESFKVLIKELQSLGLDVKVLDGEQNEIDLRSNFDDDVTAQVVSYESDDDITDTANYEGMSKDMEDAGMGYDDDKTIANGDPDAEDVPFEDIDDTDEDDYPDDVDDYPFDDDEM